MGLFVLLASPARAGGLRVGYRLHQEMDAPLMPVTRNFRLCFGSDPAGTPRLSLCAEGPAPRTPASPPPQPKAPLTPRAPAGKPPVQPP